MVLIHHQHYTTKVSFSVLKREIMKTPNILLYKEAINRLLLRIVIPIQAWIKDMLFSLLDIHMVFPLLHQNIDGM